ncbi:hypothetical protein G7Y89_g6854 [Cudoniella acicularis]|uniref:BTB domain-containing protein n=1 Tax=Cudoniella acicularis TaxID=354080 RepID=A0A8H4RLZ0_9HELO|nr:hypothetical protein G7Y89_g6854 [Cudoniella acicularis]
MKDPDELARILEDDDESDDDGALPSSSGASAHVGNGSEWRDGSNKKASLGANVAPDPTPKGVIVFASADTNPDVSLMVFNQEFWVESSTLTANSLFFKKFLHSADKAEHPKPEGPMKYKWVTFICQDGGWSLVDEFSLQVFPPARPVNLVKEYFTDLQQKEPPQLPLEQAIAESPTENAPTNATPSDFASDKEFEVKAFRIMLKATFSQPYTLESTDQLLRVAELADYYCCIPSVSSGLTASIHGSPDFIKGVRNAALDLLQVATTLKHATLFREALIHACGPWDKPQLLQIQDPSIRAAADIAYKSIEKKDAELAQWCLSKSLNGKAGPLMAAMERMIKDESNFLDRMADYEKRYWPYKQRLIYEHIIGKRGKKFKDVMEELLESKLVFEKSRHESGHGQYMNYFLCAEIADEGLPWMKK